LEKPDWNDIYHHRVAFDDFDWEDDRPLEIPPEDQIIYEMHVRSFTILLWGEASGYICAKKSLKELVCVLN